MRHPLPYASAILAPATGAGTGATSAPTRSRRRLTGRLGLVLVAVALVAAGVACRPATGAAPPGAATCFGPHMQAPADPAIAQDILYPYGPSQPGWWQAPGWVQDQVLHVIVPRESGCDPNALNPSSWAKGLFQLLGHDDLIKDACPLAYPAWNIPSCNALAAWFLYQQAGLSPWAVGWRSPGSSTGVLVAYRTRRAHHVELVATAGVSPQEFGDAFATVAAIQRLHDVAVWDYVVGAQYAAELKAAQTHVSSGGGGLPCSAPPDTGGAPPAGFPGYVIQRESGGSTTAQNGQYYGRAQIGASHFCGGGCTGQTYEECWATLWAGGSGAHNWSTY